MKGLRGEITAFFSLLLLFFLGFFAVLLEGIRVENARVSTERALNLGMSSAFTEYYRPLWEEYHIFGLSREGLEERIKEYMLPDYGLRLTELQLEEIVWGTDYEGELFLHQILAYEKHRMPQQTLEMGFSGEFHQKAEAAIREAETAEEKTLELPKELEEAKEGRQERRKMKSLRGIWGKSIREMVLDSSSALSKKQLKTAPPTGESSCRLSSTSPGKNLKQVGLFLQKQTAEQAELLYYRQHFKSYTRERIEFQREESVLDYEQEYLLEGKGSDRENLEAWLKRLVLTRTALNYLMLSRDREKSQAAYELALAALGITGMEALVRAGQQFLLLGWSYEEALVDARVLFEGGSVSFWKQKQEFSIRFQEMFTFSKELLRERARARLSAKTAAMDYEAYLSLFLGFKQQNKRWEAAWHLMDANLRLRYNTEFSIRDTVFGIHARAEYFLPGRLGKNWYLQAEKHYSY